MPVEIVVRSFSKKTNSRKTTKIASLQHLSHDLLLPSLPHTQHLVNAAKNTELPLPRFPIQSYSFSIRIPFNHNSMLQKDYSRQGQLRSLGLPFLHSAHIHRMVALPQAQQERYTGLQRPPSQLAHRTMPGEASWDDQKLLLFPSTKLKNLQCHSKRTGLLPHPQPQNTGTELVMAGGRVLKRGLHRSPQGRALFGKNHKEFQA